MGNGSFSTGIKRWFAESVEAPLESLAGGRARLKIIVLLASVLAMDSADKATVGAVAMQLKHSLHIDNVQVGLLVAVSTAVGALVTLPFGVLADRINRSRILVVAMAVWSLAMVFNGLSTSYTMLLISRLFLGMIVAAASPLVVSLTGDFFRPGERGRIFGYILAGELFGVAIGFLLSGNIAAVLSWRAAFWSLALIGLILSLVIWRYLPEPTRGGRSFVPEGADVVPASSEATTTQESKEPKAATPTADDKRGPIEALIEERDIQPHTDRVLPVDDAKHLSLWQAVRYVLAVRTFRVLIFASALGYFYFTGLRTFALLYVRDTFHLGQAVASTVSVGIGCGAIVGALLVGRIGDRLIRHGKLTARISLGAVSYLVAAGALLLGLLGTSLYVTAPLFFIAAVGVGGANPSVDAAKLDVMQSSLWGRAEGVRATLRFALSAVAAPLFGYVASQFGHAQTLTTAAENAAGLRMAMMILLVTLVAAGLLMLLRGIQSYPRDVATALASAHDTEADAAENHAEDGGADA